MGDEVRSRSFRRTITSTAFKSQPLGQPEKALGHEPQIDLCVANQATAPACQLQKLINVVAIQ